MKKDNRVERQTKWNLAKEGGWQEYRELTNKYSETLRNAIENEDKTIQEKYEKVEKTLDKIRFQAFGKVSIKSNKDRNELKNNNEGDTDEETEWKETNDLIEKEVIAIKRRNKGKVCL